MFCASAPNCSFRRCRFDLLASQRTNDRLDLLKEPLSAAEMPLSSMASPVIPDVSRARCYGLLARANLGKTARTSGKCRGKVPPSKEPSGNDTYSHRPGFRLVASRTLDSAENLRVRLWRDREPETRPRCASDQDADAFSWRPESWQDPAIALGRPVNYLRLEIGLSE